MVWIPSLICTNVIFLWRAKKAVATPPRTEWSSIHHFLSLILLIIIDVLGTRKPRRGWIQSHQNWTDPQRHPFSFDLTSFSLSLKIDFCRVIAIQWTDRQNIGDCIGFLSPRLIQNMTKDAGQLLVMA